MKAPKMKKLPVPKVSKGKDKPEQYDDRPELSFSEDQLPESKGWNLKDDYYLVLKVKMIGNRIEDYGQNTGKVVSRFKVLAVAVDNDSDEDDK